MGEAGWLRPFDLSECDNNFDEKFRNAAYSFSDVCISDCVFI
jgi:hypothetical protein